MHEVNFTYIFNRHSLSTLHIILPNAVNIVTGVYKNHFLISLALIIQLFNVPKTIQPLNTNEPTLRVTSLSLISIPQWGATSKNSRSNPKQSIFRTAVCSNSLLLRARIRYYNKKKNIDQKLHIICTHIVCVRIYLYIVAIEVSLYREIQNHPLPPLYTFFKS